MTPTTEHKQPSNLSVLDRNICASFVAEDESLSLEARDMFMRLKEKDTHPYYMAEQCTRDWLKIWGVLGRVLSQPEVLEMYENGRAYPEVRTFIRKRLENMYWSNT